MYLTDSLFMCTYIVLIIFSHGILTFSLVKQIANNILICFSNVKIYFFFVDSHMICSLHFNLRSFLRQSVLFFPLEVTGHFDIQIQAFSVSGKLYQYYTIFEFSFCSLLGHQLLFFSVLQSLNPFDPFTASQMHHKHIRESIDTNFCKNNTVFLSMGFQTAFHFSVNSS